MNKTRRPNEKAETHFEQIPLDVVKRIANLEVPRNEKAAAVRFHGVRFYENSDGLCRIVANFIQEGLRKGESGIILATPAHATGIEALLIAGGIDTEASRMRGELVLLDANTVLAGFMTGGKPNAALFQQTVIPIIEKVSRSGTGSVVRLYGEMVDVLWKDGQTEAAMRLEAMWNSLANTHAFSLLCGYALGNFYKDAAIAEIVGHHSHELHTPA
jgi:hypothetical protein